jgi:hypothetical protein
MDELLELRARLRSSDSEDRRLAVRALGRLLETMFLRDVRPGIPDRGEDTVQHDAPGPLTEDAEADLVAQLHELFLEVHDRSTGEAFELLSAIGKAKPWLSAPVFVDLLVGHEEALTADEVHEIVHSLDRSLHLSRVDPRMALVSRAFAPVRAMIVTHGIARRSPSAEHPCLPYDARQILDAIANPVTRRLDEAREYTSQLRGSDRDHWPSLRAILRDLDIDPQAAAIGEWIPEQSGPFLIVVSRAGRSMIVELGYVIVRPDHTPLIDPVELIGQEDLDPFRSYPYSIGVYAALVVLNEESPVTLDPVDALVDAVEQESSDLRGQRRSRRDGSFRSDGGFEWNGLRQFLIEHQIDPARSLLIGAEESWSNRRPHERSGTLIHLGRFYRFLADVEDPLGDVTRVRMWQVDEVEARQLHGAFIDAALRLEARERDDSS